LPDNPVFLHATLFPEHLKVIGGKITDTTLTNHGECNQRTELIMWNTVNHPTGHFLLLVSLLLSGPSYALTTYTDRAEFETSNPGLVTEGFETNNLGVSTSKQCPQPLSSSSNNTCFLTDQLIPGVEYGLQENPAGANLSLSVDAQTSRLGANHAADSLVITFSDLGVTAAGLEIQCPFSHAGSVKFFGVKGLITEQIVDCLAAPVFVAITSQQAIIRIEAEGGNTGTWELVDNLTWGASPVKFNVFTERVSFETMYPRLKKEGFEAGDLGGNGSRACPSPLDSSSDNDCFSPGDLATGVQFSIQSNPLIPQLALSGPKPGRTITLGANGFSDYTVIRFSDLDTTAVGLELYCFTSPGPANIRFYGMDGLITEETIDCSASAEFIAVSANKTIVRVEAEQVGEHEFMDNLLFGKAATQLMFKDGFE